LSDDAAASSGDASTGASALVGAVAALLVITPIVLLSGLLFAHPIDPIFVTVVLVLATVTGGVAAAAWDTGRRRSSPPR
jgi:hypothetical protein